jgi:hypothetical protein
VSAKKRARILKNRKRRIEYRLRDRVWEEQAEPMFTAGNIHYQLSDRCGALDAGGIGAIHLLARRTGLIDAIDRKLHVLKIHLPYHESDHVLNVEPLAKPFGCRLLRPGCQRREPANRSVSHRCRARQAGACSLGA